VTFYLWKMMYFKSCHFESHWRKCKEPDPELDPGMYPDPLVRGTDPWIRIRTICHGLAILRITYYEFCADPYPTFLGCDSGSILWIRLFTFCGSEKNGSSFFDFDPNWNCSTVRFRKTDKLSNTILFIVIVYQCCGAEPAKAGAAIPTFGSGSLVAL
jgi:hypothetical protein